MNDELLIPLLGVAVVVLAILAGKLFFKYSVKQLFWMLLLTAIFGSVFSFGIQFASFYQDMGTHQFTVLGTIVAIGKVYQGMFMTGSNWALSRFIKYGVKMQIN